MSHARDRGLCTADSRSLETPFLQQYLHGIHDHTKGRDGYIGEWHVPPVLDAPPSRRDRRSLWRIAQRKNYATENPILIIVEQISGRCRYRAYGFAVKTKRAHNELRVEPIP
jgi:hypothetical protein